MRYNERNSEQIGEKNIITQLKDEDSVIEVSAQIMCNIKGKIQANYDLIVYGDIDVSVLNVMGHLICFGNCKAEYMNVQGNCDVFGTLHVKDGMFSDNLRVHELIAGKVEVKGKIICDSIDCQDTLYSHDKVIVSDGVMGDGTFEGNIVLCGEYAFIDEDNKNVFVVDQIQEKLAHIATQELQNEDSDVIDIEEMDWEECEEYLSNLVNNHPIYKQEYDNYRLLLTWSECAKIKTLNQFIEVMGVLYRAGEIVQKSDLYRVVKEELWERSKIYVFDLELKTIDQTEFSKLLDIVIRNQVDLEIDVYEYLKESLFNKIGLKYSTVVMMLGD